jgi:myo-inositol-1(or 4)-monophosphatase
MAALCRILNKPLGLLVDGAFSESPAFVTELTVPGPTPGTIARTTGPTGRAVSCRRWMLYSSWVIRASEPAAINPAGLRDRLAAITEAAGRVALAWYRPGAQTSAAISMKPGNSPVSEADHAVDDFLRRELSGLSDMPGDVVWFSEESALTGESGAATPRLFWLVDPIDGTRAFLRGDPEWAISIALIEDHRPVLAALHGPALGETLIAAQSQGAYRAGSRLAQARRAQPDRLRVLAPKPLFDACCGSVPGVERLPQVPSLALRLARVATGEADLALASRGSHGWDVAAADLILGEAGATFCDFQCRTLSYRPQPDSLGGLIAAPTRDMAALQQSLALPTEPG